MKDHREAALQVEQDAWKRLLPLMRRRLVRMKVGLPARGHHNKPVVVTDRRFKGR